MNIEITPEGWAVLANDHFSASEEVRVRRSIYYDPFGSFGVCRPYWKPGSTLVDVGAHIGNWSVPMAEQTGASGRLFSIEADHELCDCLRYNLNQVNQRVHCSSTVINACAWNTTGKITFLRNMENRGASSADPESKNRGHHIELEVNSIKIDDLDLSDVAFMKIDTEGSEWIVLKGAEETIKSGKTILFIETAVQAPVFFNSTLQDMYDWLKNLGYRLLFYPEGNADPHDVLCLPT